MSAGTAVAFPIVVDATSCIYSCFVLVFTNFFQIHFYKCHPLLHSDIPQPFKKGHSHYLFR